MEEAHEGLRLYAVLLSREDIESALKVLPDDGKASARLREFLGHLDPPRPKKKAA